MSAPNLYHTLLRPPVIQILRAAGFHSASPAVIDTLTDLAARYLMLLVSFTAGHANSSHDRIPIPNLHDVIMALQDAGALRPQMSVSEELLRGEEDMRGLDSFMAWFTGPANKEIRRVAGFVPSEGDVVDEDSLEKEDYLTSLKKKHSKTGEESRYQGTVLGKSREIHPIIIEGGAQSIKAWGMEVRLRETSAESVSSTMSSAPSSLSDVVDMET
ncbi:bromodomain associated protein [Paracoccidioides lutzii Pb01]|uniref:Bromodomain associated protein n=1 Tax=Paracoccidioides lutzii (strain ATCC MYA-826 / Pb01) TaxID=502779 RepID=C1GT16_PARBA|nr:bromodomain associated protein [Paracoccidioides lutzii Pb01]EEH39199.1 bromodomain associated protein [Paracoccidioides lutzii Pb01]